MAGRARLDEANNHLDRQPGADHYSCVDKAELSKSLA